MAGEEVVLGEDADEVEPELPRGSLDAKADIGHAARDIGGDGRMGELDLLRAVDLLFVQAMRCEQLIEQQAGARVMITIDEPRFAFGEIGQ